MFDIGVPELILILVVALIVFGPKKLPEIGSAIGKGLREFRQASAELTRELTQEIQVSEKPKEDVEQPKSTSPDIGSAIGKGLREFRQVSTELTQELTREIQISEKPKEEAEQPKILPPEAAEQPQGLPPEAG